MTFKNVVKKTQPNQPTKQKSDIELMPYICKYLFECWNAENQGRWTEDSILKEGID